jgi:hypothetical protein
MTYSPRKMERLDKAAGQVQEIEEFVTDCVSSGSRGMSFRTVVIAKKRGAGLWPAPQISGANQA